MVEAAGVEPGISVENTQLTDSENASIAGNAATSKSSVQIAYKDFSELQNFQVSPTFAQHAEVLSNIYTLIAYSRNDCFFKFFPKNVPRRRNSNSRPSAPKTYPSFHANSSINEGSQAA
jgi:hypothetical protein